MTDYDVIVSGGGMVGSLLAAALGKAGMGVLVLESSKPASFEPQSDYDLRVSALSIASERMLKVLGAWDGINARRAAPFRQMKVWDGEQGGSTMFDAADQLEKEKKDKSESDGAGETDGLDDAVHHLGTIVENRVIQLALHDVIQKLESVELRAPASLKSFDTRLDCIAVELEDGSIATARLLVGADGARSRVRELAGIGVQQSRYPQEALVATVATELPQQDITWQRFLPSGPQALLPLQGQRASMVWYHSQEEVQRLKALTDSEFLDAMHNAFPAETGKLTGISGRGSFPLFRSHAERYVTERIALIGDAAHTVHPLAGQGVNLGLLDAAVLAEVILAAAHGFAKSSAKSSANSGALSGQSQMAAKHRVRDFGQLRTLRAYQRWRRAENTVMINILDGFYRAFTPHTQPFQKLRSALMDTAGRIKPLRRLIMQHAMGVSGDLPLLARGLTLPGYPENGR